MHIYEIHFRRKLRMQLLRFEEPVTIKFRAELPHLLDFFTLYARASFRFLSRPEEVPAA